MKLNPIFDILSEMPRQISKWMPVHLKIDPVQLKVKEDVSERRADPIK